MGWYAVFYREWLTMYKKIGRLGHVFSSIIAPFIYLFAFGFGLGGRVDVPGGYLQFLAGGIVAITIMLNAFQQTANSISVGKMYYHVFQSVVLSPIRPIEVMLGIVMAGMVRGLFFGSLIFLMAWLVFDAGHLTLSLLIGGVLGSFCFGALGCIVGLLVKMPDDVAFVNNFFIMPMTFFGGSFFPVENLPASMQYVVMLFPVGALNRLTRSPVFTPDLLFEAFLLLTLGLLFLAIAVTVYRRYNE